MRKLCTIGYEGTNVGDFLETLKEANIRVLVDVRELPISRRKGFSKNALRSHLESVGIEYRHEKLLGSPKELRHRLRSDWNYTRFFRSFEHHLTKQEDLLDQLATELKGNVVLMCFEKDAHDCHRSRVAEALSEKINKKPVHLLVETNDDEQTCQAANTRLSKGFSPA